MLDRISGPALIALAASMVGFGIPFGIAGSMQPIYNSEYYQFNLGPNWKLALGQGMLLTLIGCVVYSLPLATVRGLLKYENWASSVFISAFLQLTVVVCLYALALGEPWWREDVIAVVTMVLIGGVAASWIVHWRLFVRLSIEKQ